MTFLKLVPVLALTVLIASGARADDAATVNLVIQDHKFTPSEIHVPAGKPVVIEVENKDPMAEEFDSSDLQVEKVIPGTRHGKVHLQPLKAGHYNFIGEYHAATAKGTVIAE